jgi:hypothetical protein
VSVHLTYIVRCDSCAHERAVRASSLREARDVVLAQGWTLRVKEPGGEGEAEIEEICGPCMVVEATGPYPEHE